MRFPPQAVIGCGPPSMCVPVSGHHRYESWCANRAKKQSPDRVTAFLSGRNRTRTCGLAALGQARHCRAGSLSLPALCGSPRFRLASSATGGASAPRPVDVLKHIGGTTGERPCSEQHRKKLPIKGSFLCGGRNRTRTCDPIDVNDVLYQLSHATGYSMELYQLRACLSSPLRPIP